METHVHSDDEKKKIINSIPLIDMGRFESRSDSYKKLREACEDWGCFRISNHGIPVDLMSDMKEVVRCLLDLPVEIKRRNADVTVGSGYEAPSEINPLYEALGLYDFASQGAIPSFCHQLEATPRQREVIEKYAKTVHKLVVEIACKLAKCLGIEWGVFESWPCLFRMNKYNFNPESVGSSGVQIHTDSPFLTILQADESVRGLEVMSKFGDFVSMDPCPGTLLLILGDTAKAWSNGRFHNVKHRVQCKEADIRISIASFLLGPKEDDVEAPAELVDEQNPRLYVPFKYEEYRVLRVSAKMTVGEGLELVRVSSNT